MTEGRTGTTAFTPVAWACLMYVIPGEARAPEPDPSMVGVLEAS